MAKEWILNIATNRWGLNKKSRVGPVSEWIRDVAPKSVAEWKSEHFKKLSSFLRQKGIPLSPEAYLRDLGQKLYIKISEVLRSEIESVAEEDCIQYIRNLVIDRTFAGYQTEIATVYQQLSQALGVEIQPAPDEWDRRYNVDFCIAVANTTSTRKSSLSATLKTPEFHKWQDWLSQTHQQFTQEFGGKVFLVFSISEGKEKRILNPEIIEEIRSEIVRLQRKDSEQSSQSSFIVSKQTSATNQRIEQWKNGEK